jgi:glycosyltransferase involved in cell wall biosynthesis
LKVLRIIARLNVGGPARHVVWLSEGLSEKGWESVLVTGVVPPGEDDMSYVARNAGVNPVVVAEMSREISPKDALAVWRLYRLMRSERPDLVHTHTAKAGTVGRVAGLLYRWLTPAAFIGKPRQCRFVHTYHGHVFHSYYGPFKTRMFLAIERLLARLITDRIVVVSEQQRREINERFHVGRREQFRVIPLGIDLAPFAGSSQRRLKLRSELGIADADLLVGIVGRLTEVKNHEMLLDAAAVFKRSTPPASAKFLIIGDGHRRGELEAHAANLGLDNVLFLGSRNDPEDCYAALDIVALTSLNEGTPLTLIEAMASERPAISTLVGGVVDLFGACEPKRIDEGSYAVCARGIGVRSQDVRGFCNGLKFLLNHEAERQAIASRGRAFVEQGYSRERLVSDMLALYEELLEVRGDRDTRGFEG